MSKQTDKRKKEGESKTDSEDIILEENLDNQGPGSTEFDKKLKKVREELKTCQTERSEYLDGWQRAKADYLNLKKETEENRSQTVQWVKEGLFEEFLLLADSFEMAMANKKIWEQAPENWRKGVEYIYQQLKNIFQNHNLKEIYPEIGNKFNPLEEHSVAIVPAQTPDEDDIIDEVVKKGYKIKDQVLRPAQVKVKHWSKES
ncbi:MAG: nucleotide exchange factor GrpE [Candidatus Paceibacterota bacterium]